ncbi:MAG: helix-turn-helix transcriptional regulator [Bacteroidota bacterium]
MTKKKAKEIEEINRIRVILAEKNIEQKQLAKMVGKTPGTITRICNNKGQPTLKLLKKIAIALDVDITELLVHTKKS